MSYKMENSVQMSTDLRKYHSSYYWSNNNTLIGFDDC